MDDLDHSERFFFMKNKINRKNKLIKFELTNDELLIFPHEY